VGRLPLELQASYTSLPEGLEQASRSTGGERRVASTEFDSAAEGFLAVALCRATGRHSGCRKFGMFRSIDP
jgi:hypothetical protein